MSENNLEMQAILDYVHWYSAGPQRLDVILKEQQNIGSYLSYMKRYRQLADRNLK